MSFHMWKHMELEHFHVWKFHFTYELGTFLHMKNVIHMRNELVKLFTCELFVNETSIWHVKIEDSHRKINFTHEMFIFEIAGEIFVLVGPLELNKMTN